MVAQCGDAAAINTVQWSSHSPRAGIIARCTAASANNNTTHMHTHVGNAADRATATRTGNDSPLISDCAFLPVPWPDVAKVAHTLDK